MFYRVNEIFYSIQGEGYNVGRPAIFIRFSGCNLKCSFCDTHVGEFKELSINQIVNSIEQYHCYFVVLTGGEPLIQINQELVETLIQNGYSVAIETNGILLDRDKRSDLLKDCWITVSPKNKETVRRLSSEHVTMDEIKVVNEGQDLKPYESIDAKHYYLQPCSCMNTEESIQKVKENPKWRLSLQTQKMVNIR